ncbi:MAG: PLP-dependent aminotransferase family protein, partial [Clostridia bacterium]|nr:PLP-dependent aminotransferase family protein [Clostridia bacterium]
LTIALNNELPLYQQLYAYIKSEIQAGRLGAGSKLPSKRKLSTHLNISQNTVQLAYNQLIDEGYVVPSERRGYFVHKLEHMIKLELSETTSDKTDFKEESRILYDFSYQGVDYQTFPFSAWRKLTKEVINEYDHELLELGHPQGHLGLRTSIADYLRQSRGVNCRANQLVISAGTEFLLQMLIQLLGKDENIYGIENPGYERLSLLFQSNGARFRPIAIDGNGMMPEEILKSDANILCIAPAHQFPSGGIMPVHRRIQLLNWANERPGRYIIEDDYDSEFKYSGKPIPALQGLDKSGKVIYMGSFSKPLSPAIRVSYMVLPEHLLQKYTDQLSLFLCPVPAIDQKVLERFIREGYFERHLNKMRNLYKRKREILTSEIARMDVRAQAMGADAGLHLLVTVNNGMGEEELVITALKAGVKVYPYSQYFPDVSLYQKAPVVLLGFASLTEQDITKAIGMLNQAWRATVCKDFNEV